MTKEQHLYHSLTALVKQVRLLDEQTVTRLSVVLRVCDEALSDEPAMSRVQKAAPMTSTRYYREHAEAWGQRAIGYMRDGNEELAYNCARVAMNYAEEALAVRS